MSNLKQRVDKLEKAGGNVANVETVETWLLQNYGPEVREKMRGHEAELIPCVRSGRFTYEDLLVIVRHVCPEAMQSAR